MTERLSLLLREAADEVIPPVPDTAEILRQGRRQRRRRPVGASIATAAAVGGIIAGALALLPDPDVAGPQVSAAIAADDPVAAYRTYGAFSVDSTVFVGAVKVRFGAPVTSVYYTSEGALVRFGKEVGLGSGVRSRYALVGPGGTVRAVSLPAGDRVPGTDPGSPYVTYATPAEKGPLVERCFAGEETLADGVTPERQCEKVREPRRYDLVAVDLRTGVEAHRATYDGPFTWGGWSAPPATTHGEAMWALFDGGWVEYDWAAGTTRPVPEGQGPLEAAAGVYLVEKPVQVPTGVQVGDDVRVAGVVVGRVTDVYTGSDGQAHVTFEKDGAEGTASGAVVRDFRTGEVLLEVPPRLQPAFSLSPTGETLRVEGFTEYGEGNELLDPPGPSQLVHLRSGKVVPIPGDRLLGWTPEGNALAVDADADRLSVCDADTGRCRDVPLEIPDGTVRLGGKSYES